MSPEEEKKVVATWKPPADHKVRFLRRVFELERWIEAQGFVHEEGVIRHAMVRFNVEREQARKYLTQVIEDFKRVGVPVIDQSA